ncbi:MAG: hypothetical protein OHK0053_24990 [Microscillaceae bacterium]
MKSIILTLFIVCSAFSLAAANTSNEGDVPSQGISNDNVQVEKVQPEEDCGCNSFNLADEGVEDIIFRACYKVFGVTDCTDLLVVDFPGSDIVISVTASVTIEM